MRTEKRSAFLSGLCGVAVALGMVAASAQADVTTDGGAESGATVAAPAPADVAAGPDQAVEAEASSGDPSTAETLPSTDDAVDEEPAATAVEATTGEASPQEAGEGEPASDEDISLEAILEDLKRREGRSG